MISGECVLKLLEERHCFSGGRGESFVLVILVGRVEYDSKEDKAILPVGQHARLPSPGLLG
jgi:hypothetical protein